MYVIVDTVESDVEDEVVKSVRRLRSSVFSCGFRFIVIEAKNQTGVVQFGLKQQTW